METLGAMEEHQRDWPRCTGVGADQRTADDCWFVMPRPTGAEDKDLCLTPDGENKAPSWRAMAGQKHVAVVLDKYWAGDGYLSQDLATTAAAIVLQERMGYEVVVKRHAVYGPGSPNADGKVRHRIAKGATHFVAEHWPLADIMHHKWPYPENAAENLTVGFNIYVGLAVKRAFHGDAEPLRASDFAKSFVARRYKASAEAEQAYAGFSGCPSVVGWCTPENGTESLRHYVPPMCEEDPDSCGDAIIEDPRYSDVQWLASAMARAGMRLRHRYTGSAIKSATFYNYEGAYNPVLTHWYSPSIYSVMVPLDTSHLENRERENRSDYPDDELIRFIPPSVLGEASLDSFVQADQTKPPHEIEGVFTVPAQAARKLAPKLSMYKGTSLERAIRFLRDDFSITEKQMHVALRQYMIETTGAELSAEETVESRFGHYRSILCKLYRNHSDFANHRERFVRDAEVAPPPEHTHAERLAGITLILIAFGLFGAAALPAPERILPRGMKRRYMKLSAPTRQVITELDTVRTPVLVVAGIAILNLAIFHPDLYRAKGYDHFVNWGILRSMISLRRKQVGRLFTQFMETAIVYSLALSLWYLLRTIGHRVIGMLRLSDVVYEMSKRMWTIAVTLYIVISIIFIARGASTIVTQVLGGSFIVILFSFQSHFTNAVSSFEMVTEGIINVGDVVILEDGTFGAVKDINFNTVKLRLFDGQMYYVPINAVRNGRLRNVSQAKTLRVNVKMSVLASVSADAIQRFEDDVHEAIVSKPFVLSISFFTLTLRGGTGEEDYLRYDINLAVNVAGPKNDFYEEYHGLPEIIDDSFYRWMAYEGTISLIVKKIMEKHGIVAFAGPSPSRHERGMEPFAPSIGGDKTGSPLAPDVATHLREITSRRGSPSPVPIRPEDRELALECIELNEAPKTDPADAGVERDLLRKISRQMSVKSQNAITDLRIWAGTVDGISSAPTKAVDPKCGFGWLPSDDYDVVVIALTDCEYDVPVRPSEFVNECIIPSIDMLSKKCGMCHCDVVYCLLHLLNDDDMPFDKSRAEELGGAMPNAREFTPTLKKYALLAEERCDSTTLVVFVRSELLATANVTSRAKIHDFSTHRTQVRGTCAVLVEVRGIGLYFVATDTMHNVDAEEMKAHIAMEDTLERLRSGAAGWGGKSADYHDVGLAKITLWLGNFMHGAPTEQPGTGKRQTVRDILPKVLEHSSALEDFAVVGATKLSSSTCSSAILCKTGMTLIDGIESVATEEVPPCKRSAHAARAVARFRSTLHMIPANRSYPVHWSKLEIRLNELHVVFSPNYKPVVESGIRRLWNRRRRTYVVLSGKLLCDPPPPHVQVEGTPAGLAHRLYVSRVLPGLGGWWGQRDLPTLPTVFESVDDIAVHELYISVCETSSASKIKKSYAEVNLSGLLAQSGATGNQAPAGAVSAGLKFAMIPLMCQGEAIGHVSGSLSVKRDHDAEGVDTVKPFASSVSSGHAFV